MNATASGGFLRALADEALLVVDGGLSTALELQGHRVGGMLWTARLVLDDPDEIVRAHASFVAAGADVIITSAYQASEEGFVAAGASSAEARRALASTTELARRSGARFVAASVGPFGALSGDGAEYHGRYTESWAHIREVHRRRLEVLVDTGPDVFAVETVPVAEEAELIVELLDELGAGPAWLAMSRTDQLERVGVLAEHSDLVAAVGVNCVPPAAVGDALSRLAAVTRTPLVTYPNHGKVWDGANECWLGEGDADVRARLLEWRSLGARLIGGCCGNGPDDIALLRRTLLS